MMKLAVYTGLFTDDPNTLYGDLINYTHDKEGVDYIAFTNSDKLKSDFWDVRKMDTWKSSRWTARACKIMPQEVLPEYDAWLWMDNSIYFNYDPISLFNKYLLNDKYDLAVHAHCDRNCIYDEANILIQRGMIKQEILQPQIEKYKELGYPAQNGLCETGILFRSNNENVIKFNKLWFDEMNQHNSIRDQISIMYALWLSGIKLNKIQKTFVAHDYKNKHLPLTDEFATLPREVHNV